MPTFVLICRDQPNALELRMKTRSSHLAYVEKCGVPVLLGGPLLSAENKPEGSVIIFEADSPEAAAEFAKNDPYAKAGLFQSTEIKPMNFTLGSLIEELD